MIRKVRFYVNNSRQRRMPRQVRLFINNGGRICMPRQLYYISIIVGETHAQALILIIGEDACPDRLGPKLVPL